MKYQLMLGTVPLYSLPPGSLFACEGTIALKSEYRNDAGACMCYIVGTGEMFWGGVSDAEELNNLEVTPLELKETNQ